MCFPTMAGFNARTFTEARDKEIALVMLQAYNDWAIDEWCGAYPGRFIPLGIVPMWDVDLGGRGGPPHRQEGLPVDQLPRDAARAGLPELPVRATGTRCSQALCDENMVLSLHIGAGFDVIQQARGGADRPPHGAGLPDQRHHRAGPAVRPDAAAVPRPEGRAVRGRHRLDPLLLRPHRPPLPEPGVARTATSAASCPSEVFRDHILACYITDPSGLLLRDRIGIDIIAWECDYPHTDTTWPESPEFAWKEFQDAGCTRRGDPQDHLGERLPVLRLGPVRAHAEGAGHGRRAARPGHATSTPPACPATEWRKRNEAAGIGTV